MPQILIYLLLICLAGCSDREPLIRTGLEGQQLPSFSVLLMDSVSRFTTTNIASKRPIIVFLFDPNCPYCRVQTKDITDHIKSLSNIHFFLISNAPFEAIKRYYDHYQLKNYPNITVGKDDAYFNYFKVSAVPFIAIYKKEKRLDQVLIGKVDINVIKIMLLD